MTVKLTVIALQWMLKNGYPQKEIDACGNYFFVRQWEYEDESEKT
jgi:hypothetical protein